MNTTFTTYAEKKAKQFLNLLQGYTKGIRMTAILILLLMGVSNAWAYNEYNKRYLYFDGSAFTAFFSDNLKPYISPKWDYDCNDGNSNGGDKQMTSINSSNYYYLDLSNSSGSYTSFRGFYIGRGANFYNGAKMGYIHGSTDNCIKATGWGTYSWSKYAPPMKSASIEKTSTVYGGDGTEGNPYQIKKGTKISVSATATSTIPNDPQTIYYKFYKKENSGSRTIVGSESTTTTSSFTTSSTVGTKYAVDVEARNEYYGTYGEEATSSTLYFITIEPIYAILGSFNDWTHSANTWDLSDQGSNNWKATFHLDKGSHTFKVVYNSSYYGKNSTTITRASATASSLSTSGADINLTTDIAGNYTFTFNSSNKSLSVSYPTAYKITYTSDYTGGTVSATAGNNTMHVPNTEITFTANPKTGYSFTKWQDGNGNQLSTNNPYTHTMVADITINAVYTVNTYAITYNLNGGTNPDGVAKTYQITSNTITLPTPTRTGYTFAGWYDNAELTGDAITQIAKGSYGDKEYWAKWTANKYTITWDPCGGTVTPTSSTYTYDGDALELPTPTRDGYRFDGWFTQIIEGTQITDVGDSNKPTSNVTYHAHWTLEAKPELTITSYPERISNTDIFSLTITYKYVPEGFSIRIKRVSDNGYFNDATNGAHITISDAGTVEFTSAAPLGSPGENQIVVELWSGTTGSYQNISSAAVTIIVETEYTVELFTYTNGVESTTGGSITTSTPVKPTANISKEISASSANTGYTFEGWEVISGSITIADPNALTTTITATSNGQVKANYTANYYTVTLNQQSGTGGTESITVAYAEALPDINIPTRDGYLFDGYYTSTNGGGTLYYDADGKSTKTMPANNVTLHAKWIAYEDCIFFKNNLEWDNVYVYFYSSDRYWDDYYGTGSKKDKYFGDDNHSPHYRKFRGEMSQIGKTDVWYVNYKELAKTIDATNAGEINSYTNITFTKDQQYDYEWFFNTQVVRRGDFNAQLPLFVPQSTKSDTKNSCDYYNNGLWMKYNSTESGYDWSSDVNDWNTTNNLFTAEKAGGYSFTTTAQLTAGKTYEFKIHNLNSTWFGNGGTMTQTNHTKWIFGDDNDNNAKITPTITGDYVFTIYLGDGKVMVSLDYPLSKGDYRLAYEDDSHLFHPGHYIKKRSSVPEQRDTVSFFVHHEENHPKIYLQECTDISADGEPTWKTITTVSGANDLGSAVTSTGVYNFILKQTNNNGTHTRSVETGETHLYTGDFYIRTDATAGGWKSFRQNSNKMTYNSFADEHSDFNHYFVEWILAGTNVKFTIANDYSYCISDTLDGDDYITKNGVSVGCLPKNANVRFGWDDDNNKLTRAYISGSSDVHDRFLVVTGNSELKDASGKALTAGTSGSDRYGLNANEDIFKDMGNWVYQVDVTANRNTLINLTAKYNDKVQIFKGQNEVPNYPLLTSTAETDFKIRLIYNFKSNHLVMAWLADNNDGDLGADMMVIRVNQGQATQINFTSGKSLTNVKTAYAVMTFTKDFVNGTAAPHARTHYWVSFPFDVKISDVFGFGEYGDQWILQLYDGAARAEEGYWVDSDSFWRYITNKNYTLKKGVGYVLTLNLKKMSPSTVFENTDEVSLYFPSTGEISTISGGKETTTSVPPHTCTIERDNRKTYDSHWNIIGVPGFADISGYDTSTPIINSDTENGGGLSFYYEYLPTWNTYQANSISSTFKTMYGYMVQYHGDLSWTTTIATTTPTNIAARRNSDSEEPEKVSLRLEIAQGEEMADQTFVQMQQEGATTEFDMNLDLTKIINSGTNIYTLAGESLVQTAGNALPMEEVTVPVGVKIDEAGEYTFRMPEGTGEMVVELIDYETNTTTNLLLSNYSVTLPAGSNESRFALRVQPSKTATAVEEYPTSLPEGKGHKYLIDGRLIIRTADGVIYDAQGHIVR